MSERGSGDDEAASEEPERAASNAKRAASEPKAVRPVEPKAVEPKAKPTEPAVLAQRSRDEQDVGWGDQPESDDRDADWYQRERPPHHGG